MKQINLTVRFITPAFLGDADQKGAWRVPPFKAQLRYWWRFVHAAEKQFRFDVNDMCQAEAELFGAASGGTGQASKVRLRLDRWREGKLKNIKAEINQEVYLGYGPVTNKGLKKPPAIDAGEQAVLKISWLTEDDDREIGLTDEQGRQIEKALWLMHQFGQRGGRSRNGWGSYVLEGALPDVSIQHLTRDWKQALTLDWPHAIGADEKGPLTWQTVPKNNWRDLIRELATLRRDLNQQAKQHGLRHLMNYPAKGARNPGVKRMPNTLRFKAMINGEGQLYGRIFHTPCAPHSVEQKKAKRLWDMIHQALDSRYQREKV